MKALCEKMDQFLMYMLELSLDPRRKYEEFGQAMVKEFSDVRFHLVLPGILDINEVLDEANRGLQPLGINIWAATGMIKTMKSKLEDVILRQKTDATHSKKSKIIEAALAWFKGQLKSKPLSANPCYFEKALTKLKLVRNADGTMKVLYTVRFKDQVLDAKGAVIKMKTVEMQMDEELLQECMAILRKYGRILKDDLEKRFANTGLVDDAVKAFSLEYDHSKDPEPTESLKNLAKHLGVEYPAFQKSWEHLQHEKEVVVKD